MLESVTDSASILASARQQDWQASESDLIFLASETNVGAQEQFRTLRSRLYQMQGTSQLKVIVVASAVPGEGKSFVSANLAHAFALQSDRRALVIDADIRRAGVLSTLLGAPSSPGLTDYLLGEQPLENIIQAGSLKNLYLIPCGKRTSKPGELIGDSRFPALIEQLRPVFDWIIIDTPPVVPIADARTIEIGRWRSDGSQCKLDSGAAIETRDPGVPARKLTRSCVEPDVRTICHVLFGIWLWLWSRRARSPIRITQHSLGS